MLSIEGASYPEFRGMENLQLNYGMLRSDTLSTLNYISPKTADDFRCSNQLLEWHYLSRFEAFIRQDGYPCMGAQAAVNGKTYALGIFDGMQDYDVVPNLRDGLSQYLENVRGKASSFMTYIAIFRRDNFDDEAEFEKALWNLLSKLHAYDAKTHSWSEGVSDDPSDENFSFSIMGEPFFMVGLHPESSRKSRRFEYTAIAFNLHEQFEFLREKGRYRHLKSAIREKEMEFSGSINPMLSDFGDGLEAAQYSGRAVGKDWKCPFAPSK